MFFSFLHQNEDFIEIRKICFNRDKLSGRRYFNLKYFSALNSPAYLITLLHYVRQQQGIKERKWKGEKILYIWKKVGNHHGGHGGTISIYHFHPKAFPTIYTLLYIK